MKDTDLSTVFPASASEQIKAAASPNNQYYLTLVPQVGSMAFNCPAVSSKSGLTPQEEVTPAPVEPQQEPTEVVLK